METVLELEGEEQTRSGETSEEEEEEKKEEKEKEKGKMKLVENLSDVDILTSQDLLLNLERDTQFPESYKVHSPDETRLSAIVKDFQRQYSHLYPDRKPLLLCPVNECGVKKFVSTNLRPTSTIHPQLFTWEGCASFVANFLSLEPLDPPEELPRYLFSSYSVLQTQRATCFEFAALLCSLLLGAHYDAYCVSGYAVKEMCLLDQSLQECPLLDTQAKSVISEPEPQENDYNVKPLKDLKSHFVIQQEKKKQQEEEAALLQKQKLQEQESEQRPADPLRGLRVHCWVLVLSGSRNIRENFFIDPLTGNSYRTDDANFLGIESAWNNLNYYVNMQDCRNGCTGMVYDLEDSQMWEPILYGATSKKQLILEVLKKKENMMMSNINKDEEDELQPRVFEMPRSWVSRLRISKKHLESSWPGRQKAIRYRKAKLEKFAPYLQPDGLVTRLTTYKDVDCTEVVTVKEWYQDRNDHLEQREVNKVDGFTSERFKHGRVHRYTDTEREMEFSSARTDDLVRRVESPGEMTEIFEGRGDLLYYRHVTFQRQVTFTNQKEDADPCGKPVQKVVERFHRNRSKPPNEDVAERVFLVVQRRMELTYHLEDQRFIPSKRGFVKPRESTEQTKLEDFSPDMVSSFQVDPSEKPLKTLTLYNLLMDLIKDEAAVLSHISESQEEVKHIMALREEEEENIVLTFSLWTTTGAAEARKQREDMERLAAEEQRWLQEKKKDILAPLLIRLNNPETLSADEAKQLHQDCLAEFKQRLVEQANLIQERYEKETKELQEKQQWYQRSQLHMNKGQGDEYRNYCAEKTLQIHVAKRRLSMHKETAPQKYHDLDQKLKRHPRLCPLLLS